MSGVVHTIFSRLVCSFFCSTRAASILPPRPHIAIAVARSEGQGRRFFSAAEGLSLTNASTAANCPGSGGLPAMIRGEPAIGHEQSHANHACIRLNPYRVPTMKQLYASAGKAPLRARLRGGGSILPAALQPQPYADCRHLGSSSTTAHQASAGAEPISPFSILFYSLAHAAGRNSTPSGISPVVTSRHSAISSLRASATIIVVLRAPLGPSVRVRLGAYFACDAPTGQCSLVSFLRLPVLPS